MPLLQMLSFLRQLCEHTKPIKVLLLHESNVTPKSFIETVVMQLVEALQAKSAQFKGRNDLKQLFLANNFGYIANSMPHCPHSDENDIEAHIQKEIRPRLEQMRDEAIEQFVDVSYKSFQAFLVEPKEKLVYSKGSDLLTLESGRYLKEKFAVCLSFFCCLPVKYCMLTKIFVPIAIQHAAGRHLQDAKGFRRVRAADSPPDHSSGGRRDHPAVHQVL